MRELKFEKAVRDLINSKIGLILSNHHYMEGKLLAVKQDHLVIDVDQNVHYIPLQHIKTLSKNAKDVNAISSSVPYLNMRCFTELLNVMKYSWVTINGSDKDAQFGVLNQVAEDYIILINQTELLYIPTSFISNIHGVLSQLQIRLANENELQTTTNVENEKIEVHLPDVIEEPQSYELLLEKAPQKAEHKEELQTVENGSHDQLGSTQPIEIVVIHGTFNQGEDVNVDSSQVSISSEEKLVIHDKAQLVQLEEDLDIEDEVIVVSEVSPITQEEETIVVSGVNPDIQEEELIVASEVTPDIQEELIEEVIEPIHMEKTVDGLETDLLEDLDHVPNLLDYDEDESDVWGVLETAFSSRTVEPFSFDEPLGYERDFPVSYWKTREQREQDRQTNTNDINLAQEEESFTHSIQVQIDAKPVGLMDTPIVENHSMTETVNDDHPNFVDDEVQPSKSNNASITIIRMSMKDEKAILEEQYFSLAKHAANYSQNNSRKNSVANLSKGNETVDGQYISLMNHAAKMYQQLLDK